MNKSREDFIAQDVVKIRQAAAHGDVRLAFEAVADAIENLLAEEIEEEQAKRSRGRGK